MMVTWIGMTWAVGWVGVLHSSEQIESTGGLGGSNAYSSHDQLQLVS